MGRNSWIGGLIVLFLALLVGYAGWRGLRASTAQECYACKRPIHAHSKTVAAVNGRSRLFCCPACALSEHEQEGKPVRITELTSYLAGAPLSPDSAYVVRGSDVNMCATAHEMIDSDKHPAGMQYDRCAPSLLAFAQRSEAVAFAGQHGGEVVPFKEVAAAHSR